MTTPRRMAPLLAGLLLTGCGNGGTPSGPVVPGSAPPTTVPPITVQASLGQSLPNPAPATPPPGAFVVDCGPLPSCLAIVAAAEAGLSSDHPPYSRVTVVSLDAGPRPSPTVAPTPAGAIAPVDIQTILLAYWVDFSWPGGSERIPVFQASAGWIAGLPPAAARVYRFVSNAGPWREPTPFALGAAEYHLTGGCGGDGADATGGAIVVLQRVGGDGSVLGEAARLSCGPAETGSAFGETIRLEAGNYRLSVEEATGRLDVTLEPITAE